MREKLARFMVGRNGNDQLNLFLMGLALALLLIAAIFNDSLGRIAYVLVFALLGYAYFRMFSRNIQKRQEENGKYIRARYRFSAAMRLRRERWVQRKDYKFFTCRRMWRWSFTPDMSWQATASLTPICRAWTMGH